MSTKRMYFFICAAAVVCCMSPARTGAADADSYSLISPVSVSAPSVKTDSGIALIGNVKTSESANTGLYRYSFADETSKKVKDFATEIPLVLFPAGNGNFPLAVYVEYASGQNVYDLYLYRDETLQKLFAGTYGTSEDGKISYYKVLDTQMREQFSYDGTLGWAEIGYENQGRCENGQYTVNWEVAYKMLGTDGLVRSVLTDEFGQVCGEAYGDGGAKSKTGNNLITTEGDTCAWIGGIEENLMINGVVYGNPGGVAVMGLYQGTLYRFNYPWAYYDTAAQTWVETQDEQVIDAVDRLYHVNTYKRRGSYDYRFIASGTYADMFELIDIHTKQPTYIPATFSADGTDWTVPTMYADKYDLSEDGQNIVYVVESDQGYAAARIALPGFVLSAGSANPAGETFPLFEHIETNNRITLNHARLTNNTEEAVRVSAMAYTLTGASGMEGFSAYLFRDRTCDGNGYVMIGTATVAQGAVSFTGLSESIASGASQCYLMELRGMPNRFPACQVIGADLEPSGVQADTATAGSAVSGTVKLGECGSLYRLEYEVAGSNPVSSFRLIEPHTSEILYIEGFYGKSCGLLGPQESQGFGGAPGQRFYYTLQNTDAGSQLLRIYSTFANQPLVRLGYCLGFPREVTPGPPREVTGCTFFNLDECVEGDEVAEPYRNCSLQYAGVVNLFIMYPAGTRWREFTARVLDPLRQSENWAAADVDFRWMLPFGLLRSRLAMLTIDTRLCRQYVLDALPGQFTIKSQENRLLYVEYEQMPDAP